MLFLLNKIAPKGNGGEGGIRTLDALLTHTPLAGERLQPLGHLSSATLLYPLFTDFQGNPRAAT